VPAAEPGDEHRAHRLPVRRRQADFEKPLPISTQVLLDRERCVLCQRCTRFSEEIAGDPFIDLLERGANQQIGWPRTSRSRATSRQHHPDLPGRGADQRRLPVPVAPVRSGLHDGRRRAHLQRGGDPDRHPARHPCAPLAGIDPDVNEE
jgi:hypothetical protein